MRKHGDAGRSEGADLRLHGAAALEFDAGGPGSDDAACAFHRLLHGVVGVDGKVGDHGGVPCAAGDSPGVVDHVVEGDVRGVRIAEHDHAEGVADEDEIDAGFVHETRGRVIVGGECCDLVPGLLELPELMGEWVHWWRLGQFRADVGEQQVRLFSPCCGKQARCILRGHRSEELCHGPGPARQHQIGADVGQRVQHEEPHGEARMGQCEGRGFDPEIPRVKNVEIHGARGIFLAEDGASKAAFERGASCKKVRGGVRHCNFHHGIEEGGGTRGAIDRRGLVERRDEGRSRGFVQ